jgi:nucleoside-diphosphate-sugar epimerase
MNRLILGCGYLGRRVADAWIVQGDGVTAVTRSASRADDLRRQGLTALIADVLKPESLGGLPEVETVLYAIGLDRASGATMRSVFVEGLRNVLAALPAPKRFLYVSSSSVYGQSDASWVDEDSPTEPQEESGRIVLEAELLLRARLPRAITLRFGGIYGPGRLLRQKTIEAGEAIVGDPDKWLNLIHVEDGVRAVLAAEERGKPGRIYNICDGEPVRRREFYSAAAQALHAPGPRFMAPPAEQPALPHEKGNRRICNRRMREELGVKLRFPNFACGLAAPATRTR